MPSPSLRGSGLKLNFLTFGIGKRTVSLFTREWIEIAANQSLFGVVRGLPLYEGVD